MLNYPQILAVGELLLASWMTNILGGKAFTKAYSRPVMALKIYTELHHACRD